MKKGAFGMALACAVVISGVADAEERQVTFSIKNHHLDNNDSFSRDGRFLCYDSREVLGPGIENSQSIEKVEIATGRETLLYAPEASVTGEQAAPGVGAVSYCPVGDRVVFIHGPDLKEVPARGYYAKPNRCGMEVEADGSGRGRWLDARDVARERPTVPGAHRGGTHRHEFTASGNRIGFTYDDWLLPDYGRTIGYMDPHPDAPAGAACYFAILVPVVPAGSSKPGEIEYAAGDSWVGADGRLRAFIGTVRAEDGVQYEDSLFVAEIPPDTDITTADSGDATRYPKPPRGVTVRRLTHGPAAGIVRGSLDGSRIAYFAPDTEGRQQVFIIASDGSDQDANPAKRPIQVTHFPEGAGSGLRWHPSGNTVFCIAGNGVAATCVRPGPEFGQTVFLTPQDTGTQRFALTISPDGTQLAFNKAVPTFDARGNRATAYNGHDFVQIFVLDFTDADSDGVADS
ncbi:MAG TPA: DUF3748 domain-containing protein [Candidatus Hydrogenedentes bacterium]|nr:DUF3748 domain-containing protein [Candidatus Hydrogenedentota bacterium]HPG65608.1 DUF3748 domain-containing protein [Candidatus Hydrogenedentota bacterium]